MLVMKNWCLILTTTNTKSVFSHLEIFSISYLKRPIILILNCKRLPSHCLVKSGLALGSPGYLFVLVWLSPCREGPIHRKMIVDCPLVITSKVKPFSRLDKTRKEEWLVQPVFCIVDTGSCSVTLCLLWGEDRQDGNEQRVMREIGPHGIIWSSFGTSQANMDQAIYNITRHCKRLPSWIELLGVSIDFFCFQDFSFCVKSSSTSVFLSLALFNANWLSHTGHSYANLFF